MIEKDKFYKLKLIKRRVRHGLIIYSMRNFLQRFGLDFDPYYIELEGVNRCQPPVIKDDVDLFSLKVIDPKEFLTLYHTLGWNTNKIEESFTRPHKCLGLFRETELTALMVVQLDHFYLKGKRFDLQSNEAFLENMYTYEAFRGKNLAPYLRYLSYKMLEKKGIDVCFSGTEYYNRSSLNFKKKLNVKHLKLYLHLGLFRRFRWNFLLKSYT